MCSYLGLFWSDNLLKMAQNVYQIIERSLLCKSNKILIKCNNNLQKKHFAILPKGQSKLITRIMRIMIHSRSIRVNLI